MKDVALFLAGAGSALAACLYVLAERRREREWPARSSDWSECDYGDFPSVTEIFHTKGDTL